MLRRIAASGVAIFGPLSHPIPTISCQFSAEAAHKPFSHVPWKHRHTTLNECRKALTEYLHYTRSLPYVYADNIAANSPRSLSEIASKVPFSSRKMFSRSFERFLRYNPINELRFFLESIGLSGDENDVFCSVLPPNTIFISEWNHFNVACALEEMGFPWCKLGLLCGEGCSIFDMDPSALKGKFIEIKDGYSFSTDNLIGICLAIPLVLCEKMDGLLSDLKVLFVDHDLCSSLDGGIDDAFEVCKKVQMFYDLGCEMGKVGELMGRSKSIFVEYSKEDLFSKIDYFCKLNVQKDQIGLLLLSRPEIFGYDLKFKVISVSGLLKQLGLSENKLKSLKGQYPHVFGRNRMINLPSTMRSMDLGEWFFERMKHGCHSLLDTYAISCIEEDLDKYYTVSLMKIQTKISKVYTIKRLHFLHSIGFGENMFAIKALAQMKGSARDLQLRFDCFLHWGVGYSKVCKLVSSRAKILNQKRNIIEKKLEFLCTETGLSLQLLDEFPGYLIYNLEKRIKPRYRLHKWLEDQGFCEKKFKLSTIIAPSEKTFVHRISCIHPPSAKKWVENSLGDDRAYLRTKAAP